MGKNRYALVLCLLASSAVGCGGSGGAKKSSASTASPAGVQSSSSAYASGLPGSSATVGSSATATGAGSSAASSSSLAGAGSISAIGPTGGGTISAPPTSSSGAATSTTPPSSTTGGGTTTTPPSNPPSSGGTTTTPPHPTPHPTHPTTPHPTTPPSTTPPSTPPAAPKAKGKIKDAASLAQARGLHTATVLDDGRVLVVGGYVNGHAGKEVFAEENEIYDTLADSWTKASKISGKGGMMLSPHHFVTVKRVLHTATKLKDGRVLITGGWGVEKKAIVGAFGPDVKSVLETAHIFDPRTNKFESAGEMNYPRYGHTATLMQDGRVLIAGGYSPGFFNLNATLAPIEIYDPVKKEFQQPGFLFHPGLTEKRQDHAAIGIDNDGAVLLIGGQHFSNHWLGLKRVLELSTTGEVYSGDKLTTVGKLAKPRRFPAVTTEKSGKVVVLGGDDMKSAIADVEVFDRATGKFASKAKLETPRTHAAAAHTSLYALAIGGFIPGKGETDSIEAFDGKKVCQGLKLAHKRNSAAVAELQDGRVLIVGGFVGGVKDYRSMDGNSTASCEVYSRN